MSVLCNLYQTGNLKMKIRNENGIYIATFKHRDGTVCMGFAPSWKEAVTYCLEILEKRDSK
jgi:hypothetical protein